MQASDCYFQTPQREGGVASILTAITTVCWTHGGLSTDQNAKVIWCSMGGALALLDMAAIWRWSMSERMVNEINPNVVLNKFLRVICGIALLIFGITYTVDKQEILPYAIGLALIGGLLIAQPLISDAFKNCYGCTTTITVRSDLTVTERDSPL